MPTEEEKTLKAVDLMGEYFHNQICAMMVSLRDQGGLTPHAIEQANIIESLSYANLPEEDKEKVRAHCRVLLLDILKAII